MADILGMGIVSTWAFFHFAHTLSSTVLIAASMGLYKSVGSVAGWRLSAFFPRLKQGFDIIWQRHCEFLLRMLTISVFLFK